MRSRSGLVIGAWSLVIRIQVGFGKAIDLTTYGTRTRHPRLLVLALGQPQDGVALGPDELGLSVWDGGDLPLAAPHRAVHLLCDRITAIWAERGLLLRGAVDLLGGDRGLAAIFDAADDGRG